MLTSLARSTVGRLLGGSLLLLVVGCTNAGKGVKSREERQDFSNADLRHEDLNGIDLSGGILRGANLEGVEL